MRNLRRGCAAILAIGFFVAAAGLYRDHALWPRLTLATALASAGIVPPAAGEWRTEGWR